MKTNQLTVKQKRSIACPACGVAAGKRCILFAGGLRNEPHPDRKLLAAEALENNQEAIIEGRVYALKKKEKESGAALLVRLRQESANPRLTKSVRESATKEEIAS